MLGRLVRGLKLKLGHNASPLDFPKTVWLAQHLLMYNASAREIPPRTCSLSKLSIGINLDYLEVFD
jgi:hypothetical protein